MKFDLTKIVLLMVLILCSNDIFARTYPSQPLGPFPPPNLPLDGSVLFLVIIAIVIGFYKTYWKIKQYKIFPF